MTDKYKVEITYTEGPATVLYIHGDGSLDPEGEGPPLINPVHTLGDLTRLCAWLKHNGGTKIELTEESS